MSVSVGVILASVRPNRRGEAFAQWALGLLAEREGVQAELLDLKDWPMGPYDLPAPPTVAEKTYAPDSLHGHWSATIAALDAYVIVTPEYSHGYPGALKNALDALYTPWNRKPVTFVSYGGFAAGARAVEQLRQVAVELRMVPIRDEVNLRLIGLAVDDAGRPSDEIYAKRAGAMIDELLWWTHVLRDARAANPR
jgi:NAD(P)H-dependent FMN reductase